MKKRGLTGTVAGLMLYIFYFVAMHGTENRLFRAGSRVSPQFDTMGISAGVYALLGVSTIVVAFVSQHRKKPNA
jgi:hypothetical protein